MEQVREVFVGTGELQERTSPEFAQSDPPNVKFTEYGSPGTGKYLPEIITVVERVDRATPRVAASASITTGTVNARPTTTPGPTNSSR
jgi:hypothetical protein